jgi:hypothetical protein
MIYTGLKNLKLDLRNIRESIGTYCGVEGCNTRFKSNFAMLNEDDVTGPFELRREKPHREIW